MRWRLQTIALVVAIAGLVPVAASAKRPPAPPPETPACGFVGFDPAPESFQPGTVYTIETTDTVTACWWYAPHPSNWRITATPQPAASIVQVMVRDNYPGDECVHVREVGNITNTVVVDFSLPADGNCLGEDGSDGWQTGDPGQFALLVGGKAKKADPVEFTLELLE